MFIIITYIILIFCLDFFSFFSKPAPSVWSKLGMFPDIFFVQGSALEAEDLVRAGIHFSDSAAILAKTDERRSAILAGRSGSVEAVVDSDTIFMSQAIRRENRYMNIVAELVQPGNIPFLAPTRMSATGGGLNDRLNESSQYFMYVLTSKREKERDGE